LVAAIIAALFMIVTLYHVGGGDSQSEGHVQVLLPELESLLEFPF